jgi:ATP-dependent Lhr-like helicase
MLRFLSFDPNRLSMTVPHAFSSCVATWFESRFGDPTIAQAEAWPAIRSGRNVLVAAPTGSGKTLAAFLAALDSLVRQGIEGTLKDETQIVYVSPLKALSNDIHRNLDEPLAGIRQTLEKMGLPDVEIRASVRTGDTSPSDRGRMLRRPPHIVVTTPESLYILLGSETGRAMLSSTRTIIVDEIHAVAATKRGSHLALSLERLSALASAPPLRIASRPRRSRSRRWHSSSWERATARPRRAATSSISGTSARVTSASRCQAGRLKR